LEAQHPSAAGDGSRSQPHENGLRKISSHLDSRFDKFSRADAPLISAPKGKIGDQFKMPEEAFR
jgi:hypothetical protein